MDDSLIDTCRFVVVPLTAIIVGGAAVAWVVCQEIALRQAQRRPVRPGPALAQWALASGVGGILVLLLWLATARGNGLVATISLFLEPILGPPLSLLALGLALRARRLEQASGYGRAAVALAVAGLVLGVLPALLSLVLMVAP